MESSKFKEFLEETRDIVNDDKTNRRFKVLGQSYFDVIAKELELMGYTKIDSSFKSGAFNLSGDHVLIAINPRTKIGIYMSIGLYFNERRRLLIRAIRSDGQIAKNRYLRMTDFCNRDVLLKSVQMIIKEDCTNEIVESRM